MCTLNERIFKVGTRESERVRGEREGEKKAIREDSGVEEDNERRDMTEEKQMRAKIKGIKMVKRENGDKVVTSVKCKALMLTNAFTSYKFRQ